MYGPPRLVWPGLVRLGTAVFKRHWAFAAVVIDVVIVVVAGKSWQECRRAAAYTPLQISPACAAVVSIGLPRR